MFSKLIATGAVLLAAALPILAQGYPSLSVTPTLLWPKNLTYYTKPQGYADVPGRSHHEYSITWHGQSGTIYASAASTLKVHDGTTYAGETNTPISLSHEEVWSRFDILWCIRSLDPGSYTSSAKCQLSIYGGASLSETDPGSFSVVATPPPPPPGT